VIDAERVLFVDGLSEEAVQLHGAVEIFTEWLLEYDPAPGRKPGAVQRPHRSRRDCGRESEVDNDRVVARDHLGDTVRIVKIAGR
jgi:hypothetical protein